MGKNKTKSVGRLRKINSLGSGNEKEKESNDSFEAEETPPVNWELITGFLDGLRPTPSLTCAEWADMHRVLTTEASAEPGQWRTSRTPYLKEILECLSPNSPYKKVVFKKSSQVGATECALNVIGTYADISPCPILYIMPTKDLAKSFSKTRLKPMIDNTPRLNKKIKSNRERDADNTTLEKSFPGGQITLTGANSSTELASRAIRVLLEDEVDRYPLDVEGEGSPMSLAEKRTQTFGNRKIFILGTPTIQGASAIDNEVEKTDARKYFVQLPCCEGPRQILEFENLIYEVGKYSEVKYCCANCGALVEERYKPKFLDYANAHWVATAPENANRELAGFIINGLYSPLGWLSWAQIVKEYEEVKDDPTKLKSWTNTVLGESYAEKSDAPPWENLYNRRSHYAICSVASEVSFLTAGADVQRDRIEIEVVGWCKGKVTYSIDYQVFAGDTSAITNKVWKDLSAYVNKKFHKENGAALGISMLAIDSGYNTNIVYEFCRKFDASRVIPTKGQDSMPTVIRTPSTVDVSLSTGQKVGTIKLWHIGVSVIKSELYGWLRQENIEGGTPDGYCYFPQYGPEYFKGITAENMEYKIVKGYKKYEWVKKFERNEPLDCRVYARAAAAVVGMDRLTPDQWDEMRDAHEGEEENDEPKKKGGSDYWARH
jgi:phage terminase large subunit GpA-like protein